MKLSSNGLGEVVRLAIEVHGAEYIKRCLLLAGVWYVWI